MKTTPVLFRIFLFLTLLVGLAVLHQRILFHGDMATGDHGRDFYAAQRSLQGDLPYRDYSWHYGPLMPFYYAAFDRIFGVNMTSILLGKALLTLCAGVFIYGAVTVLTHPLAGLVAATWFYVFHKGFAHTHSHAGGIAMVSLILLVLSLHMTSRRMVWLWAGLFAAFILALVKLNFGLSAIPALWLAAYLTGRYGNAPSAGSRSSFYVFSLTVFPLAVIAAYWPFLQGLSVDEINQCLPFFSAYSLNEKSFFKVLMVLIDHLWNKTLTSRKDLILTGITLFSMTRLVFLMAKGRISAKERSLNLTALAIFSVYYLLNLHEFLGSGRWYSIYWAEPVGIVWLFFVVYIGAYALSGLTRVVIFLFLLVLAAAWQKDVYWRIEKSLTNESFLGHPRAQVFVSNEPAWIRTVEETSAFLEKTVRPGETFFALPYDPMFYYLTGKKSPTRMLIFFNHTHIKPDQEDRIIREISSQDVRYVVVSNRMRSSEPHLGILGKTYCPKIARYIEEDFVPVAQFGEWQKDPGWGSNLGTRVLVRKDIQPVRFMNEPSEISRDSL